MKKENNFVLCQHPKTGLGFWYESVPHYWIKRLIGIIIALPLAILPFFHAVFNNGYLFFSTYPIIIQYLLTGAWFIILPLIIVLLVFTPSEIRCGRPEY